MKAVVLFSGGLDSTVLLWNMLAEAAELWPFSVDYGQKHHRELTAAADIARLAGLQERHRIRHCPGAFGHVKDGDDIIVPNRNFVMIGLAASFALTVGAEWVAIGCTKGDHERFPDCRLAFLQSCDVTLRIATDNAVKLLFPFVHYDKRKVVGIGTKLGAPLALSWSCYEGGKEPCGKCLACENRTEAGA